MVRPLEPGLSNPPEDRHASQAPGGGQGLWSVMVGVNHGKLHFYMAWHTCVLVCNIMICYDKVQFSQGYAPPLVTHVTIPWTGDMWSVHGR